MSNKTRGHKRRFHKHGPAPMLPRNVRKYIEAEKEWDSPFPQFHCGLPVADGHVWKIDGHGRCVHVPAPARS